MSSSTVFYAIGDFMTQIAFLPFEFIGNAFNYVLIAVGFFGMLFWLNWQRKFNQQAENNPNQLK